MRSARRMHRNRSRRINWTLVEGLRAAGMPLALILTAVRFIRCGGPSAPRVEWTLVRGGGDPLNSLRVVSYRWSRNPPPSSTGVFHERKSLPANCARATPALAIRRDHRVKLGGREELSTKEEQSGLQESD